MSTIKINTSDYYGKPALYPFMPSKIFNALEKAFKAGDEYAEVDKDLFDEMMDKFNNKKQ